jgi:hypothetical protein
MPTTQIQTLIPTIVEQLRRVQEGDSSIEHIIPYESPTDEQLLEGVLFLKPEATDLLHGVNVEEVLLLLNKYIEEWGLQVGGLSLIGSEFLKRYDIIARHYGVLNNISRQGMSALSDAAKQQLHELFGSDLAKGAIVLGAHEAIARFPEFSPPILNSIVDNIGSKKLAPGTYCSKWKYGDDILLLLNAFHPYQLEHFTAPQRAIAVLDVRCHPDNSDWRTLRNDMLGVTDPEAANQGSMRRIFLDRRAELKISTISRGYNAVHFSAGPLEGMVETIRYFSDYANQRPVDISMTCFGQLLLDKSFDRSDIEWLMANPTVSINGVQAPAFDLGEEIQPADAVRQLKEALANRPGQK